MTAQSSDFISSHYMTIVARRCFVSDLVYRFKIGFHVSLGTPPAEWAIDESLVRRLLRQQMPALAEEPIRLIDTGWDNVMYRAGENHVVRMPRRNESAPLVVHEQTWLPALASKLPIAIPAPIHFGESCDEFPWRWSVLPWFPGSTANLETMNAEQPRRLAEFLLALHQPVAEPAPVNEYRGVPLSKRADRTSARLQELSQSADPNVKNTITDNVREIWDRALATPKSKQPHWIHGDLHARNVLVSAGEIVAIIDWGDITAGDVSVDLSSVWMLFDSKKARAECLQHYGATSDQIVRAKGWTVSVAAALLQTGLVDHPQHAAMGQAALRRINEGE
jgi:aminoglycoside phosphotransferase (APT) family kinase protein